MEHLVTVPGYVFDDDPDAQNMDVEYDIEALDMGHPADMNGPGEPPYGGWVSSIRFERRLTTTQKDKVTAWVEENHEF